MPGIISTFKSGEPPLSEMLSDINYGKIQLPDFQRGWIWDDDHIRSLIDSVSMSYPIGAVMLLQTGGDGAKFQPRLIEGVDSSINIKPDYLILDGQQRLTSMYLSLSSEKPVPTRTSKNQEIMRFYYLNMGKCLDPNADRLDAIVSVPVEKILTSDFGRKIDLDISTPEKEFQMGLFPLNAVFNTDLYNTWRRGYQGLFRLDDERYNLFDHFESEIIKRFQSYRVPVIELLRDTPKVAVCNVFEKVNTGGVTLTVFELVTAIFAADNYNLRKDWESRIDRIREQDVLKNVDATAFLTAVTLLASYNHHNEDPDRPVSCKRVDILKLTLDEYKQFADKIESGLKYAARLLAREKVFDSRSLPYGTQLIPLSTVCAVVNEKFEQDPIRNKITQWYWSGVFGELYGGANETRFALDVPELVGWIDGGPAPRTIRDANFSPTRLLSMQSRLSAAYKGLMALLMKAGSLDLLSGDQLEITNYFDMAVDIHHIFPKAYCRNQGFSSDLWNSSVNKAPLSAKTNRLIGGKAPSTYVSTLERDYSMVPERLNELLVSHQVNPELLRADQFNEFIRDRASKLLNLIEIAMNRKVTGRDSEEVVQAFGGSL